MVEIRLPKNSRPQPGKQWPKPEGAKRLGEFRIYRWNPDDSANPRIDVYWVDRDDCGPMVLDALIWIKIEDRPDADLPPLVPRGRVRLLRDEHRRRQHARLHQGHRRDRRRGEDLSAAAQPVVKDLVPDLTHFYAQHALIEPWLKTVDADAGKGMAPDAGGPRQARRPLRVHPVRLVHDLLPELLVERRPLSRPCRAVAGLSLADRLRATRRTGERLDELEDPFRLYRCHTIMNCAKTCPKGLNPAKAIAHIKGMMNDRRL